MSIPSLRITDLSVFDLRFPTSRHGDGSDAMNPDPDYSAPYVVLHTDSRESWEGHGLTFTLGRGNELCVAAIKALQHLVIGSSLAEIAGDMSRFWRRITSDSQLRWLGPDKGVVHLATAAIVNAVWDLYAKVEGKPLWQLVCDMPPEELVGALDFRYITDAITPQEGVDLLARLAPSRADRIAEMESIGYPAYITSVGWLGYSEEKIRTLCRAAIDQGWPNFKMKVGRNLEEDMQRAAIIRQEIGDDALLMMDANQVWDVDDAIRNTNELARFRPYWMEEPTSPDDVLGHAAIAKQIAPVRVATGECCQNRILFKQFLQADAMGVCQIDSVRLGGVNEVLSVLLMAAKYNVPVCPHAGGIGLCEYAQHLAMIDYIAVSGSTENRMLEYVDHLHEHFLDPVRLERGRYMPPQAPGYSITMHPESIERHAC